MQQQFSNDSDFFKWIGEALLLAQKSSEAQIAFERALQLDPNSPLAEASAASPYVQSGDAGRAIAHLERALSLDPLYLPAASTLMGLYQKEGKTAEADALAGKIKAAMDDAPAAQSSTADSAKTAEQVYKNIQILKGVPADQIIPAMQFISTSLGVECTFCHVEGHLEKDDKKPKQVARDMMQMMFAFNKNNFEGHREVTCYSCHRGAPNPVSTPNVVGDLPSGSTRTNGITHKLPENLPSASELIDGYINALGGAAALSRITSRVETGREEYRGQSVSVELFTKAPEKQALIRHLREGESATVFDGRSGWFVIPGRPPRDMHGADMDAARMDADLQFPLHIGQLFPELRVEYPATIAGHEVYTLFGIREGLPPTNFFFDEQSGLLERVVRYAESPLGRNPTQIDYSDYREVDGVQIPFRITLSQPGSASTIQMTEVRQNVQIDDSKFTKPASNRSAASFEPARQERQPR